jgi:hypothetical protein
MGLNDKKYYCLVRNRDGAIITLLMLIVKNLGLVLPVSVVERFALTSRAAK